MKEIESSSSNRLLDERFEAQNFRARTGAARSAGERSRLAPRTAPSATTTGAPLVRSARAAALSLDSGSAETRGPARAGGGPRLRPTQPGAGRGCARTRPGGPRLRPHPARAGQGCARIQLERVKAAPVPGQDGRQRKRAPILAATCFISSIPPAYWVRGQKKPRRPSLRRRGTTWV